jgi:hypothetical protein
MSKPGNHTRLMALGLFAVLAIFPFLSNGASAQGPSAAAPARNPMMMGQNMMATMKTDNTAADERLTPLLDRMNAATGQAKVDAMAAVVTELVAQRAIERGQMAQMSGMMTPGMMGLMIQGMTSDMRSLAAQCPMMKGFAETPK